MGLFCLGVGLARGMCFLVVHLVDGFEAEELGEYGYGKQDNNSTNTTATCEDSKNANTDSYVTKYPSLCRQKTRLSHIGGGICSFWGALPP